MQREYCHLTCYAIYRDRNVTKIWKKTYPFPLQGRTAIEQMTWLLVLKSTIAIFTDAKSSIPTPHAQIHYSNLPSKISKTRTSPLFVFLM